MWINVTINNACTHVWNAKCDKKQAPFFLLAEVDFLTDNRIYNIENRF